MSEQMPDWPQSDDALLNVDRAHKALEKINVEIEAAIQAASEKITAAYAPIDFAAQSALYDAMSRAASAGFTYQQLREVMDCDGH